MRAIFFTALITAATLLGGCATAPAPTASGINYSQLRYEATRFEKAGLSANAQQALFKTDIDSCEAEAQKQYQASVANSAKLAALYGQPITPQALEKVKYAQVVMCMAGDKSRGDKGKGWTASK